MRDWIKLKANYERNTETLMNTQIPTCLVLALDRNPILPPDSKHHLISMKVLTYMTTKFSVLEGMSPNITGTHKQTIPVTTRNIRPIFARAERNTRQPRYISQTSKRGNHQGPDETRRNVADIIKICESRQVR